MDKRLEKALEFANFRQTFSIQQKTLKEKSQSKLSYGFNGGLFLIDQTLMCFVQMLIDQNRTENIILLDQNNNPVLVEDLVQFKDEIFDRYFQVTNEYYISYQNNLKNRSIKKLLSYE